MNLNTNPIDLCFFYLSLYEIRNLIEVDSLGYLSIEGLKEALCNRTTCLECFTKKATNYIRI